MNRTRALTRRHAATACLCSTIAWPRLRAQPATRPDARWYRAADAMRQLALSWGDQPYGAVLVVDGAIVGEGPSRVVKHRDATAHAEREAIRDAQRKLGRQKLEGSVLVSTSRPCGACEDAAAEAGVARMWFGADLDDAGAPRRMPR
jgi:tRNA(adenine34) deaminase